MKVVILCGGLGTRLREETEFKPKPMVKIGDRPILWHIMKIFSHAGYKEYILCLGYKGEMIREYFYHFDLMNNDVTLELGRGKNLIFHQANEEIDWKVTMIDTGQDTLKGARLKQIENYIDGDTFLVTYGDGLADINLNELIRFHKSHGKVATVTGVNSASRFGELIIKEDRVIAFNEKPKISSAYINGGFFVFNKKLFEYLSFDKNCDLEIGPLQILAQESELMVFKHPGSWACMDTIRDMDYLNRIWHDGNAFWRIP